MNTLLSPVQNEHQCALALFGGSPSVTNRDEELFSWPIITAEDEEAAVDVLRKKAMSGIDITKAFEREFSAWLGTKYALGFNNGTASLLAAMFGVGIGVGDEVICPATTYWASALPAFGLGGTVVFADIIPETLCLDPADIIKRITPRTKAIVVVHYLGHPAEMDAILQIARQHGLAVIEDVSHAHGGMYKGQQVGTFGDVACFSMMAGKPLAIGEGGMLATNDISIYERALAFGHYERFNAEHVTSSELLKLSGLPLGGFKNRMHQISAAVGRVQLKHYNKRCAEIRRAMNYFWDLLEDVPGIRAHRVDESTGSTMGGWYAAHGHYVKDELNGLSITRYCEALRAEGLTECVPGCNQPLHRHPVFFEADIYRHGLPTRIAHSEADVRQAAGSLPGAENLMGTVLTVPWFKHYQPKEIESYAAAFRKVAENSDLLLTDDQGDPATIGSWNFFKSSR